MREVDVKLITDLVSEMCMEANYQLSSDMRQALSDAQTNEKSELGKNILAQLQKNLLIAQQDSIPICQDTGMAVFPENRAGRCILMGDHLQMQLMKGFEEDIGMGFFANR